MCAVLGVALVGQQLHLVAPCVPRINEQSLDQPSSDAAAAMLVADIHRLDERSRPTCVRDVRHDQERSRADCVIAVPGEVHAEVVGQEHPSPRRSLAFCQVSFGKAWSSVDESYTSEEVVGAGGLDRIQTLHEVNQRPAPLWPGLLADLLIADASVERDGFGLVRRRVEMEFSEWEDVNARVLRCTPQRWIARRWDAPHSASAPNGNAPDGIRAGAGHALHGEPDCVVRPGRDAERRAAGNGDSPHDIARGRQHTHGTPGELR